MVRRVVNRVRPVAIESARRLRGHGGGLDVIFFAAGK